MSEKSAVTSGVRYAAGVVDLVIQLGLHRAGIDRTTRAGEFGDDRVGPSDVGQREAEPMRVGDDAVGRVLEVAPSAVHSTLQQVADHRRVRDGVPVVQRPPELVADRPDEQRRVGDPPAHDDLRAGLQTGDDRVGADVGVGRDDPVTQGGDRCAPFWESAVQGPDEVKDGVAADDPNGYAVLPLGA
jgi:hypothetical protein